MKPLLILAALAAAALVLRRDRPPVPDADDSEVVGMPTYRVFDEAAYARWVEAFPHLRSTTTNSITIGPTDWDEWFHTAGRKN